jgi:zinc transport system substrate-binding protein
MRGSPFPSLAAASLVGFVLALALGAAGCSGKRDDAGPTPAGSAAASGTAKLAAPAPTRTGAGALASPAGDTTPLRIGVTLPAYFSWTANLIAGIPEAEVVPVAPSGAPAGGPTPEDLARLARLDALVINGLGHDAFIQPMLEAAGNPRLLVIDTSLGTPPLKAARGDGVNAHTFLSFGNAIAQSKLLADKLGALRPDLAERLRGNAAAYAEQLRKLSSAAAARLADAKVKRVVTVHDGYAYLLQELGVELVGVVQPAHDRMPSDKELGEAIALMKKERVAVLFTEADVPEKLLAPLRQATSARTYVLGDLAAGEHSAARFETEMARNADTLVQALVTDPR